jgi:leucyl/phenylalanyl-tRNA--protein transferase
MPVYLLPDDMPEPAFPPPHKASEEGLLAVGGALSPETLLLAYTNGIFPWYSDGQPLLWWSPDPRFVLFPEEYHCPTSLKKIIRKNSFTIKFDTDFASVIHNCSLVPREGQDGTWITDQMIAAYCELHRLGYAHSVEAYDGKNLVGGLYGVSIGKMFAGESMFALSDNASKVALYFMVEKAKEMGFDFIDCQVHTDNLERFGAKNIERKEYLKLLKKAVSNPNKNEFV